MNAPSLAELLSLETDLELLAALDTSQDRIAARLLARASARVAALLAGLGEARASDILFQDIDVEEVLHAAA